MPIALHNLLYLMQLIIFTFVINNFSLKFILLLQVFFPKILIYFCSANFQSRVNGIYEINFFFNVLRDKSLPLLEFDF